jgi:hypothetical protein
LANYEALIEHPSTVYPYGLVNMALSTWSASRIYSWILLSTTMFRIYFLLELPEMGHPAPIVNMVDIRQIHGDSHSTIPEERSKSTGSTHAITNPYEEEFLAFPPNFGGAIFAISADEPSCEGETDQERAARVERTPIAQLARWSGRMPNTHRDSAPLNTI